LKVELDQRRGLLDVGVKQEGKLFSSRIISEGTLRVIALCAIATNPWSGSLVAFEEPENGVHPKRIELVAKLINSMATDSRQVIVTSHSPLFCAKVVEAASESDRPLSLLSVSSGFEKTRVKRIDPLMPLFRDDVIRKLIRST
jgi:predicted ATPase